jgi:hypothetical protein
VLGYAAFSKIDSFARLRQMRRVAQWLAGEPWTIMESTGLAAQFLRTNGNRTMATVINLSLDSAPPSCYGILGANSVRCLKDGEEQILPVDGSVFEKISEERSPEGVLTVAKQPSALHRVCGAEEGAEAMTRDAALLLAESLRDPGNLGTIIRSAKAFGVKNLVLSSDCADLYNPRTIRAAMGTLFSQNIYLAQDLIAVIEQLRTRGGVDIVLAVFTEREGEHVGRHIQLAVFRIDGLNLLVTDDGNVHFGVALKLFHHQNGVAATANEHTDARGNLHDLLLVFNYYSDFFHTSFPFSFVRPVRIFHRLLQSLVPTGDGRRPFR